ncbi:hypothetical protein ED236_00490 [Pseudomethylobacillus aquaticus]|uniref:Uncharacterized protein n=1 Tax=Pseudomethylobacillus aquaticus TaxID=2676064 RepID=A0A3N0V5D8_9PROT|nr:hypothetical protein [Pseudomethylobacillus aquaticus]ROH88006.1 hypothetical protein ED236_00490 [Pseudomethylobacillus aquaticus]
MPVIKQFGGLDNVNAPTEYGLERLAVAKNVDITAAGKLVRRRGRQRLHAMVIDAAVDCDNGTMLMQSGRDLYRLSKSLNPTLIRGSLQPSGLLSATKVNHQVFWSNGVDTGVLNDNGSAEPLGIRVPALPAASAVFGHMPPGRYQYTMTYQRADGTESGAPVAGLLDIQDGGILVESPANAPSDAVFQNLYLTNANGTTLYLACTVNVGMAMEYKGDTLDLVTPLRTQFCGPPPAFSTACHFRGRMYYAFGNVLWASMPHNYQLVDYTNGYIQLPESITLLAVVDNGIYIATETETGFCSGDDIEAFTYAQVLDYGAIPGTARQVDAASVSDEASGKAALWASLRGAVAGFSGGIAKNLTDRVYAYPAAKAGCAVLREQGGQRHFLASLQDTSQPYNARQIPMLVNVALPPLEVVGSA